jgi:DNA topoisomerase IB
MECRGDLAHGSRVLLTCPALLPLSQERKIDDLEIVADPEEAAEEAGLRYVSDEKPVLHGSARQKFVYFDQPEKSDSASADHLFAPIPPAYSDV